MKILSRITAITFFLAMLMPCGAAQASLVYVEDAQGQRSSTFRTLIQWTHSRLVFDKDLERVAIGQEKTLEVEILGGKELLLLAKQVGKTTLIVWYADGKSETYLFSVTEDLSVLRSALSDIHPGIQLEQAPDRQALVLRGRVPSIDFKLAAEVSARHYLGVRSPAARTNRRTQAVQRLDESIQMVVGGDVQSSNGFRLNGDAMASESRIAIINLIKVDTLPQSLEERITSALQPLGISTVNVRRILKSDLADDRLDTFVLEGTVADQVTLTRVLNLASQVVTGDAQSDSARKGVEVIADESGSLMARRTSAARAVGFSDSAGNTLRDNEIKANIGRATLLSMANGRLLSMIDVEDLPQVRVSVQIHEVNRNKLHQWRPDFSLISRRYSTEGALGLAGLTPAQFDGASVENAMQVLGGALTNNVQLGSKDLAFDLLFSLMEQEGISRTLSRPTLLVLAGESAVFNVGGEVPVPTAFAPSGLSSGDQVGANTAGVFSGTTFKSFGVKLSVRAMVDEHDQITLDLNPEVSTPDTLLTQQISGSTGSSLNSSAFNTRSISTTTRLQDGQPLVIGGLVYSESVNQKSYTPGANKMPLVGKLAESDNETNQDRELFILVTPTLVRERNLDAELWSFPAAVAVARHVLSNHQLNRGEQK